MSYGKCYFRLSQVLYLIIEITVYNNFVLRLPGYVYVQLRYLYTNWERFTVFSQQVILLGNNCILNYVVKGIFVFE